jgi:dethiobiotin synthetase
VVQLESNIVFMADKTQPRRHTRLFVTGTDTGVGKTFITAALLKTWRAAGYNAGGYKPAVSGCDYDAAGQPFWGDVEALSEASGRTFPRHRICPQCFIAPLAPPVAAKHEGRCVDDDLLRSATDWWRPQVDVLLVEGAGGLLAPLSETQSNADLASALNLPVLVIARTGLGTINHSLLTVEAAQHRGLNVVGIVLNTANPGPEDLSVQSNPEQLAQRCDVPILAVLPHLSEPDLLQHPAFLRMSGKLWDILRVT